MSSPTLPTDSIFKLHLSQLFKNKPNLYSKVADLNESVSSVSSNNSVLSTRSGRTEQPSRVNEVGRQPIKKEENDYRRSRM